MPNPSQVNPSQANPSKSKGRVLYIGASYYNNWYLSRALRDLGWEADVLTYSGESAELYLHGHDFSLKDYTTWDNKYPEQLFRILYNSLRTHSHVVAGAVRGRQFNPALRLFGTLVKLLFTKWPMQVAEVLKVILDDRQSVNDRPQTKGINYRIGVLRRVKHRILRSLFEPLITEALRGSKQPELLKNMLAIFIQSMRQTPLPELTPILNVLDRYDILHFTGVNNLRYFYFINPFLFDSMPIGWDLQLLRRLGKKIVYSNTGCLDGVAQSSFRTWPPEPVCDICRWRDEPTVCSDERNLAWGALRNSLTDYQIILGGNRKDHNDDPQVHEVPEFYCLDPTVWDPDLPIPPKYLLSYPEGTVKIYHAVGNFELRTLSNNSNIKCTHIYVPLIKGLKREGYKVEFIFYSNIPNKEIRFYQMQADIIVDMLTFGWFGATAREGLMLGKPVVCFLRPEWLDSMRREIPEYIDELPIISATPYTVHDVLTDLIEHPEKRCEIGRRSRDFAKKWHSAEAAAKRIDSIYGSLLS